jgi:hypothetical protein
VLSRTPPRPVEAPAPPEARGPLSAAVLGLLRGEGDPGPEARGPLSTEVLGLLRREHDRGPEDAGPLGAEPCGAEWSGDTSSGAMVSADPYGEDLQLALYCCYETHYRGFAGVPDEREWDVSLLGLRVAMEQRFLAALRRDVPADDDVDAAVSKLLVEPVGDVRGVSHHLRARGEPWQLREYVAHRSLYHLKEADPQAWVIPRLAGPAKAALVGVEHDEYGSGDPDRMHAHLFAVMMDALGLDSAYGAYVDAAPAETLAEVNFISLCGLRRALRGALVGQFALVELTSSPGSERLVRGMRRMGCPEEAVAFYAEHVEADAVHEQQMRLGVLGPLLAAEPDLAGDVVFGIRAGTFLAERFSDLLLDAWEEGRTSLRRPLEG